MPSKILTVDDSRTIRMIVTRAFKNFACEIFEAGDGVEGLTVAQRVRPDLIILDLTMPVMDGIEMLSKLKADPELRPIPVIMLTAEAGRENVLRIAKLGVRDYLIKPFKEEMIVERVGRVIELKAKNDAVEKVRRYDDPLQILLVDDKPAILERVQAGVAATPWTVRGASNLNQAIDACAQSVPDIALVSLSLPDGTAFTLFQALRGGVRTKSIPVLGLSVKTATEEQAHAQQLGFAGIITKPIDAGDLQVKITRALGLDTSYKYFHHRDEALVVALPAEFNQTAAFEISQHLRAKLLDAVDSGLSRVVIDMSPLRSADVTLVKLGLEVTQICFELALRCSLIGSEAVYRECKNYEETKDWQFASSFEEAMAGFNGKAAAMA